MKTTDLVKDWLASEGYKYNIDSDGDLIFMYQGFGMWVRADENDPLFLSIVMPNIYEVDNDYDKVQRALNQLNSSIKTVKGFVVNDNVWLAIEMYIDSSPEMDDFLERCLDILIAGGRKFAEELRNN